MSLDTLRLLIDFGLVVLIWLVQLIIYPGFSYYNGDQLVSWHNKYTKRITLVVLPLMLGQLMVYGSLLTEIKSIFSIGGFTLVLLTWFLTFTVFVPLHKTIDKGEATQSTCERLTTYNWSRTILWSALFLWNGYEYVSY